MGKIKVLVVDDSTVVQKILTRILNQADDIEVVGVAPDPLVAMEFIERTPPDVITLDVEMPKMDGITFLRQLMRERPMPVLMISTLMESGAELTIQALELGAVDFINKPKVLQSVDLDVYGREIRRKLRVVARARVRALNTAAAKPRSELHAPQLQTRLEHSSTLIAIGASTGGVEAIKELLLRLPHQLPPIVIAQHIPPVFTLPFANRLGRETGFKVFVAEAGQQLEPGSVYLAPGNNHLLVMPQGHGYSCRINDGPPVRHYRPSVDLLFYSVAKAARQNAIGVLLTGMGDDGATGLQQMKEAGATTIAQDEATSVVWGMPHAAIKLGCVDEVQPLQSIADRLVGLCQQKLEITKS